MLSVFPFPRCKLSSHHSTLALHAKVSSTFHDLVPVDLPRPVDLPVIPHFFDHLEFHADTGNDLTSSILSLPRSSLARNKPTFALLFSLPHVFQHFHTVITRTGRTSSDLGLNYALPCSFAVKDKTSLLRPAPFLALYVINASVPPLENGPFTSSA